RPARAGAAIVSSSARINRIAMGFLIRDVCFIVFSAFSSVKKLMRTSTDQSQDDRQDHHQNREQFHPVDFDPHSMTRNKKENHMGMWFCEEKICGFPTCEYVGLAA